MFPDTAFIKHYQIVSCLGQGGFGKVFEAWDSKLQRSVAIKCLSADGLLSPAADLMREARMAASLNHPAFVKIHALEDDDNSQAIVMELVKGETLKQVITSKKTDLLQTLNIIRQLAEAMQQAHAIGLTHGDLKPSNVMLEPTGAIRILDFGLASKADNQATTSMLQQDPQGTIAYMAPERLLGAPLSPSIDVYALGVIFYELLNGQRPFADLSGLALAAALVQSSSDQWNYSQEISPSLIHVIRRMTAKQAAQRLSSMAEVLDQLDAFKNGTLRENNSAQPEIHIPPKVNNESPKQQRNKNFKNAVFFSLVVIGCVVLGGWLTRNFLWHFEEVIPRYSESQEMKLGMDALEQWDRPGSLDAAIKHFNNLAEQNPENAAAIAGLSIAYSFLYLGDERDNAWSQKAMAGAQRAVQLNPHLALAHIALGRAYDTQQKWAQALGSHNVALALDQQNLLAWHGKVGVLYELQRYEEALELIARALNTYPQAHMLLFQRGMIYTAQGQYVEAEQVFRVCISLRPDSIYTYANLSGVFIYQGRFEEARQVIQDGLEIRPSDYLYTNLGNIYFAEGDYLNAVVAFEAAVAPELGNAGDYVSWANLADALLLIPGRQQESEKYYSKASQLLAPIIQRQPNNANLISRLALYKARLGDKAQCKTLLMSLLLDTSTSPDLHFRVGLAYELIGERGLALKHLVAANNYGYPLNLIEAEPGLVLLRRDPQYSLR